MDDLRAFLASVFVSAKKIACSPLPENASSIRSLSLTGLNFLKLLNFFADFFLAQAVEALLQKKMPDLAEFAKF